MGKRKILEGNVFDISLQRLIEIYSDPLNRIVLAFSAGKDSGVCLELAIMAARHCNRLPVEVFMCDDEIMYPGTYEYAERVYNRKDEVKFYWTSAREPMVNVFNRKCPYYWVFDELLQPEQWVRQPPPWIVWWPIIDLYMMMGPKTFPMPEGGRLINIVGLRAAESKNRLLGIHSAGGWISGGGVEHNPTCYPIYDWSDGDVWKAISDNKWDYNSAYDVMLKMGLPRQKQRIAPPTMAWFAMDSLQIAAKAWPKWFDRVCNRLEGIRPVANFGMRAVQPMRKAGESWEECYQRECIDNAPEWIAERAIMARNHMLTQHSKHSTQPFPEIVGCNVCNATGAGSWKGLAMILYTGDPYTLKATFLPYVQPSVFRPSDTRVWEAKPAGPR